MQAYKLTPANEFNARMIKTGKAICNIMQDSSAGRGQLSSLVPTLLRQSLLVQLGSEESSLDDDADKLMCSEEHFEVQGWPVFTTSVDQPVNFLQEVRTLSAVQQRSLMGNSMHVGVTGHLVLYILMTFESVDAPVHSEEPSDLVDEGVTGSVSGAVGIQPDSLSPGPEDRSSECLVVEDSTQASQVLTQDGSLLQMSGLALSSELSSTTVVDLEINSDSDFQNDFQSDPELSGYPE